MPRYVLVLVLVLHPAFTRSAAAQTAPRDTLADPTSSGFHLAGSWLRRLPIDDPRHALVLVPGVRLTGADIGVTPGAALLIRGSAAGRGNIYVDGALLRFETLGGAGVGLAPNAIEALSVVTGAAPASLADVGGGVIAYETRAGGERLSGGVRWDSDEPFSNASSVGYNRIEGVFGGPLARAGTLTFFLSGTLQGQRSSYRGLDASNVPAYLPAGTDTIVNDGGTPVALPRWESVSSGLGRPLDWSTARRAQAKLQYRYGSRSSLSLTLLDGDIQQRAFPGQVALDSGLYSGRRLRTGAAIVNWQHELGTWDGGPLRLDVNMSLVGHRDLSGPLDTASELATRDPSLGIAFKQLRFLGANVLGLPTNDALVRGVRANSGLRGVPFFGLPDATESGRINPYGLVGEGWFTQGIGGRTLTDVAESRMQGRWMVSWNPSSGQAIDVGVDAEESHVSSYTSDLTRQVGTDLFTARPKRLGGFVEDRLRLGHAVIDAGVRYDRIKPGGDLPITPGYIASSGAALWNPNAATDDTAYANSVARVFRPARTHAALSPRLRFSYALSDKTAVRLGYSRTVEPPSWGTLFRQSNSDLSFTDARTLFGRDVDVATASLIEGGVRSSVGPWLFDVSAYRKDLPIYGGGLTQVRDPRDTTKVGTLNTVTLYRNTHAQGIDASLDWRNGWLSASGVYSLAHTVTQPIAGFIFSGPFTTHDVAVVASLQIPNDWKRGSLLGAIGRDADITVLGRAHNGAPYTRLVNNGIGTLAPDGGFGGGVASGAPLNGAQLPSFKRLDLRIAKRIRTAGNEWSIYLDARNLLNFSSVVTLFAETGDTANPLHKELIIGAPAFPSGQYAALWNEASSAGALAADKTVDLTGCAAWGSPVNCVALTRVERRFGDGNQLFTLAEQQRAFDTYYRDFFGAWRFYAPRRTIRVGLELSL